VAWLLGAALYLPEQWLTSEARQAAQIPRAIRFQEKWRLALALLRRVRASGMQVTAVLGDAEFGDNGTLRQYLRRVGLPYALGISSHLTVFPNGKPSAVAVRAIAERLPRRAWRVVTWRNGANRAWKAQFAALRVTPAQRWPHRRRAPEVWLLCERDLGATPRTSTTLSRCPCRHRAPPSCTWRTSGGPSNSSTKSSKTNRGSIISRGDRLSGGIAMSP
jgi:SRSO17 transposase